MKLSILLAIFSGVLVLACSSASSVPDQEPSLDKTFEGALGKKGIESTPTSQPDGEFTMNEDEDQAVFDSYYFRDSGEPDRLGKPKYQLPLTIKDPEDLRDLVVGKGPDERIFDDPDLVPATKSPPWINKSDGDSSKIVPTHVRKTSPERDDGTIRGRLFYNDLRLEGRFNERRDPNGNPGLGISSLIVGINKGCYRKESNCDLLEQENLLSARKVVVEFWEVDRDYKLKDRRACDDWEYLGRSTVGIDGDYSLNLSTLIDDCPDGNTGAEIVVRFILRFCNSDKYCFELSRKSEEGQAIYSKYHRDAKPSDPLIVNLGSTHNLVDEKFGGDLDDDFGKEWAIAANHYASLVDTMHVLHDEAEIPFRFNEYGGLVVYMCPSAYRDRLDEHEKDRECFKGRARGTALIGITAPTPASTGTIWPWGGLVPHEYGHIVDARTGRQIDCLAWGLTNCNYGREPDDEISGTPTSWSATSYEYPYAALIEGWGSFVSRVVLESCDEIEENTGPGTVQPNYDGSKHYGNGYVRNVTKLLCDWYDEHREQDDDAEKLDDKGVDRFPGYGDRFEASLWSIWYNLDKSTSGKKGKDICDYARYYIEERKGSARVGQSDHDFYKERIVNLLYNNGLKCGYEAPEPNTADDRRGPAKNGTVCHAGPSGRKECS